MALLLAVNSALALRLPFGSKPNTPHLDAPKLPAVALAAALSLSLNVHSALAGGELAADLASKVAGAVPTVDVAGAAAGLNDNINANIGKTDFQERLAKTKAGLGGWRDARLGGELRKSVDPSSPPAQKIISATGQFFLDLFCTKLCIII